MKTKQLNILLRDPKKVKSVEEFRKRVYITKSVPTSKLDQLFDNSKNTIKILKNKSSNLIFKTFCTKTCFVVFRDAYHKGWSPKINDISSKIF